MLGYGDMRPDANGTGNRLFRDGWLFGETEKYEKCAVEPN